MSDPKSGSDPKPPANTPPASAPPTNTPPVSTPANTTAKVSADQLAADNAALKLQVEDLEKQLGQRDKALKEANDVLEAQAKERLIKDILPMSKFTADELSQKPLEELQNIRATLGHAITPTYKNIHFPPVAGDQDTERDTVGDLSVVTAKKLKAGRA